MRSRSNADRARALWGMKGNFWSFGNHLGLGLLGQHADRSAPDTKEKRVEKRLHCLIILSRILSSESVLVESAS